MHALPLIAATLLLAFAEVACADTVTLRPATGDGPHYPVEGTITDYTGAAITIEQQGRERRYPAERVVTIDTTWPQAYAAGQQLMAERAWAAAAQQFTIASREEKRTWAQRIILTDLMRCRLAVGQAKRAGDLLIVLAASDPATPAWSLAPLPWYASDDVSLRDAESWFARQEEAARLLGAAWLLTTAEQNKATAQLRSLARSPWPEVALLAETQLWRLSLPQADNRQTDRWATRLASVTASSTSPTLLAGPQHLLAQALLRQKRYDDAALTAIQAPLNGQAPHRLAARGLLLAGQALKTAGRTGEAETLFAEILRDYNDTPQRQDAEALSTR